MSCERQLFDLRDEMAQQGSSFKSVAERRSALLSYSHEGKTPDVRIRRFLVGNPVDKMDHFDSPRRWMEIRWC